MDFRPTTECPHCGATLKARTTRLAGRTLFCGYEQCGCAGAEAEREKVQLDIDALEDDRDEVCDAYRGVLSDFIADAQRKLDQVNATYSQPLASHARSAEDTGQIAAAPLPPAAGYQVPLMGAAADAPAPVAFSGDKDLSGFGDVADDFDFDDPE